MPAEWLPVLLSLLVPRPERHVWLASRMREVSCLHTLVDRGELPLSSRIILWHYCLESLGDAFWRRVSRDQLQRVVRGPAFVLICGAFFLAATALGSWGFRTTRRILDFGAVGGGPRFGTFLTYAIPIVFAAVVSVVLVGLRGPAMKGSGWRYNGFLSIKTLLILVTVPLAWMELGPVIRALRPETEGWRVLSAVLSRMAFIGMYAYAIAWSFADQRWRCPVCLKRLALPVAMGSWGSVFEPARNELLCEQGHGVLECRQVRMDDRDQWIKMDGSWQEGFEPASTSKRSI